MSIPKRKSGWCLIGVLCLWAALGLQVYGQPKEEWDVTQPRGLTREIDFTTSEGTFMSVDLSPDGRWIVFDLLAHIYRMPVEGGEAQCLTQDSGVALNYHPRFSPDGNTIAFVSDRKGQNNLWIMNGDGSEPRPVYLNKEIQVTGPKWTPDGQYILVNRRGSGIWMYHRDGGQGVALPLTQSSSSRYQGNVAQRPEWPSASMDGRYIYFQVNATSQRGFVEQDLLKGFKQLRRFDTKTKEILQITGGEVSIIGGRDRGASSGGGIAPEISPDGRWLAFARRIPDGSIAYKGHEFGPRTALFLRDMKTGAERLVMDPITVDMTEGMKTLLPLPAYRWAGDGKSILLSQGGKIRRLWIATGRVDTIPFTARVKRTISEMTGKDRRIDDGPLLARFQRWHSASPDGRRLAFQAVGKIWIMEMPAGKPKRLTPASFEPLELAPTWSPDGQWIAFTSWDGVKRGRLWKSRVSEGTLQSLTEEPGEYMEPAWSADGRTLAVFRGSGATARGRTLADNLWYDLVTVPSSGGEAQFISRIHSGGARPILGVSFGPDDRLYYVRRGQNSTGGQTSGTQLASVNIDGSDLKIHLEFPFAEKAVPSPDGRWIAFQEADDIYLIPSPPAGPDPVRVERKGGVLPVKRLSFEGGLFPSWRDARTVEFGAANRYYRYSLDTEQTKSTEIDLQMPRRIPSGTIAFEGARIITLENRKVIEEGSIVVENGRLTCVGECDLTGLDRVIDISGKTVIPGFIDMHAHHYQKYAGVESRRSYESAIYLAYGITTNLDPFVWAQNLFPLAELIETGGAIGPRTFTTSDAMSPGDGFGRNAVDSYETTELEINRRESYGAVCIKQYAQRRRDQRQWIVDVSRKKGLTVTSEGGNLAANLGMIMDGQTGWEHPLSYMPLYSDAAKFFGKAGAVYAPTIVVGGPGAWNDEYWFQESDVWKDKKQRRFLSWRWLFPHTMRRTLRPVSHFSYPILAQGLADIIAEGGYGAVGGHGQHHGLGPHWEVWMYSSALGPMGGLEVGSLHGAHFLRMEQDIGSLATGKLADLMVLHANPLEDIRNTARIQYVMKGGVLYDAETLDEIWPEKRPFGKYYWVDEEMLRNDRRSVDYWNPKKPSGGRWD